jgi:hypothetical protein
MHPTLLLVRLLPTLPIFAAGQLGKRAAFLFLASIATNISCAKIDMGSPTGGCRSAKPRKLIGNDAFLDNTATGASVFLRDSNPQNS